MLKLQRKPQGATFALMGIHSGVFANTQTKLLIFCIAVLLKKKNSGDKLLRKFIFEDFYL